MDTLVSFDIKKLLFNKGWCFKLNSDKTGNKVENSLAEQRWNEGDLSYIDITILEVKMWLYKEHDIWIYVKREIIDSDKWEYSYVISYLPKEFENEKRRCSHLVTIESFIESTSSYIGAWSNPNLAYEAAIEYCLIKLLKN